MFHQANKTDCERTVLSMPKDTTNCNPLGTTELAVSQALSNESHTQIAISEVSSPPATEGTSGDVSIICPGTSTNDSLCEPFLIKVSRQSLPI